jgi:hypothetical protein
MYTTDEDGETVIVVVAYVVQLLYNLSNSYLPVRD